MRLEQDALGSVQVSDNVYWGIQTERSRKYFSAGSQLMPARLIQAYGWVKRAAAEVNGALGCIAAHKVPWIVTAATEVAEGKWGEHFPVRLWQTGSGTHTNMNVNEVIANRAIELAGGVRGSKVPVHPYDDVNCSQSTNDTFPTAMSIAALTALRDQLLPALRYLEQVLQEKAAAWAHYTKVGRTHLMDATPLTLGQEFSGYAHQVLAARQAIEHMMPWLGQLAMGGTAVGTGLAAPPHFGEKVAQLLAEWLQLPLTRAPNAFAANASHDTFVLAHGALKTLATALIKITTDMSWMVSGPTCGLHELNFQTNEPGSSIMAGKINPTQCEALTMICVQVHAHDVAISMAGSRGNFELNLFKPLIIYNFLESISLLSDGCQLFTTHFLATLQPNTTQLRHNLEHSMMIITALLPKLGYDRVTQLVHIAQQRGIGLRTVIREQQLMSDEEFDALLS